MRRGFLCLCTLLLGGALAHADQVTLKNGDRLTGTIVTGDGKTLLIKTEFTGDVTVQWDAITDIESQQVLNLTLKDGTRLSGKITTVDGKFVAMAPAAAAPAPTSAAPATKDAIVSVKDNAEQQAADLAAERMAHPKFTYFWSGLFDTGLALTRGNSSTTTFTLATKEVRETPKDKLSVYATYIYGNDDSTPPSRTIANALSAGVRGDLNLSPKLFAFAFANYETNALQNLNLRQVYGGGLGYHIIKTANTTFDVFGGFSYDRDAFGAYTLVGPPPVFYPATNQNSAEVVIGEEFDTKFNKRSALAETFSIYPNLSHTGDYRMQFNSTFSTLLKNWLSWQLTFSDSYISYPPPGLKANDLVLSTGLRVAWGKAKL